MKKYKKIIFIILVIIVTVLGVFFMKVINYNKRLPEARILELREKYPVRGYLKSSSSNMIEIEVDMLEAIADLNDTFLYCEITGNAAANINTSFAKFYVYVIADTENIFEKGEQIVILGNTTNEKYGPSYSIGMQFVLPVSIDKKNRIWPSAYGTYYVTEDGYVIAAYDEEHLTKYNYTGIKVERLMKELKKLIE